MEKGALWRIYTYRNQVDEIYHHYTYKDWKILSKYL